MKTIMLKFTHEEVHQLMLAVEGRLVAAKLKLPVSPASHRMVMCARKNVERLEKLRRRLLRLDLSRTWEKMEESPCS